MNPLQILKESIKEIPILKYCLGVVAIAATIAIVNSFGIENSKIPIVTFLVILAFMILLFIFSTALKSRDRVFRFSGYILIYTTVIIACGTSILLTMGVFWDIPYEVRDLLNMPHKEIKAEQITITGIVTIDNKIQKNGYVGILQKPELHDKFSQTGSFLLDLKREDFPNNKFPSNGVVTLTYITEKDTFELMDINLFDLKNKNNVIELKISLSKITEEVFYGTASGEINGKETIINLKIEKVSKSLGPQAQLDTVKNPIENPNINDRRKIENQPGTKKKEDISPEKKTDITPTPPRNELPKKDTMTEKKSEDLSDIQKKVEEKLEEKKNKDVYQENDVDRIPVLFAASKDQVKASLDQLGIRRVEAKVLVDENGSVTKVIVLIPSDSRDVSYKLKMLQFEAASLNGKKVKCWTRVKF